MMINPYEMVSKSALPALRAMVAKRLRENYHLTQQQVADRLGVTQASVSNYSRKARGVMIDLETDPKVAKAADKIAKLLSTEGPDEKAGSRSNDGRLRLHQVQPPHVQPPQGAGAQVQVGRMRSLRRSLHGERL